MRKHLFFLLMPLFTFFGYGQILQEGFDDITTLTGSGWTLTNQSSPLGTLTWFQGNPTVFPSQSGADTSYIGANYNSTSGGTGTISNWLITPTLNLKDGDQLKFWTRVPTGSIWNDRLEIRSSVGAMTAPTGGSSGIGSFTNVLLTVNPNLDLSYPEVWTEFTVTISGVGNTPTAMNLAFRYFVPNAGPSGTDSNFIGIDTVSVIEGEGGGDPTYCGPIDFTFNVEPISNVVVAGISNATDPTLNGTPDHEFFLDIVGEMSPGETYPIALEGNTDGSFTNRFVVFIDWNQNGILNDAGEVYEMDNTIFNSTGSDGQQALGTIIVPTEALEGNTRMRVKKIFGTTDFLDPCLGTGYGQVEDYTINVSTGSPTEDLCDDTGYSISSSGSGNMISASVNVTESGVIGTNPGDFSIDEVSIDIEHTWADDLEIVLISPSGTEVALTSDNGGSSGLDVRAMLVFKDSSTNAITSWDNTVPLADYRAEGGDTAHPIAAGDGPGVDLNTEFAGEEVNGTWTLRVYDDAAGDGGTVYSFCLALTGGGEGPVEGCLNDPNGQWPGATFTPSCSGAPEVITTIAWTGEYSKVNVTAGTEYVFSSSVATDFITISDENGTIAYAAGTSPLTWTATANEVIRFYSHFDSDCNFDAIEFRSRIVQCGDILPPPPNDDCANAIAVSCGDSVSGATTFATNSGGNAAGDVFYSFTGTGESQMITVSLCGSSYDTYLRVFTDCSLSNEITFNDDFCDLQSELSFVSDGTSTYYIMVEGFSSNVGNFVMNVSCDEVPVYDPCAPVHEGVATNGVGFVNNGTDHYVAANDFNVLANTQFEVEKFIINVVTLGGEPTIFDVTFYEGESGVGAQFGDMNEGLTPTSITPNGTFGSTGFPVYSVELTLPTTTIFPATTTQDKKYWVAVSGSPSVEGNSVYWVSSDYAFTDTLPTWQSDNGGSNWYLFVAGSGANVEGDMVIEGECATLGLSDMSGYAFSYYPNPVKDILNINSQKAVQSVEVFNLAGQAVISHEKALNGQIDVSSLASGTYVFRVILEGGEVETFKIIKK